MYIHHYLLSFDSSTVFATLVNNWSSRNITGHSWAFQILSSSSVTVIWCSVVSVINVIKLKSCKIKYVQELTWGIPSAVPQISSWLFLAEVLTNISGQHVPTIFSLLLKDSVCRFFCSVSTRLHATTCQMTDLFIVTAKRISNLTQYN
jgi:hypothetical protein